MSTKNFFFRLFIAMGLTHVFLVPEAALSEASFSKKKEITHLLLSQNINLQIQKPTSDQVFSVEETIVFEGVSSNEIKSFKLLVDDKWELKGGSLAQGKWSLTYKFTKAGDRKVEAIGFDSNGQQIASDSTNVKIKSSVSSNVVSIANDQWLFFEKQTMRYGAIQKRGRQEGEPGYWQRIVKYWKEGVNRSDVDTRLEVMSNNNPWSAAFISYVFRKAGAANKFPYSAAHYTYITHAIRNRRNGTSNSSLVGYRITEYSPKVGDLVCAPRSSDRRKVTYENALSYKNSNGDRFFSSHCDIVVSVSNNSIDIIGGNVSNSVTQDTVKTESGKLVQSSQRNWITVIQNNFD